MKVLARGIFVFVALAMPAAGVAQDGRGNMHAEAGRIFALANQVRAQAGVGRLDWDPALADAPLQHRLRMAAEGPISHQYNGEPDLSARTAQAGARYSVIEENVAMGPSADTIHEEWITSPGHRANLLSPDVDRVGIAVVAAHGSLYAGGDYSRGGEEVGVSQVET